MACRLINLHQRALRVDLRSGSALLLAPGEASRPLREELLYDNQHLGDWERVGWVRRLPARMSDVLAADAAPAAAARPAARPAKPTATAAAPSPPPKAGRQRAATTSAAGPAAKVPGRRQTGRS